MSEPGPGGRDGSGSSYPPLTTTVSTLTASSGAISSTADYEYGPYIGLTQDGRAKVAWCDPAAKKIYLRHLDRTLTASERPDTVLDGYKLFGLVVHSDGRAAVLAVTPATAACTPCTASTSCVSCDQLHLIQVDNTGTILQDKVIDDRLAHNGMFSGGSIALGTHSNTEAYAVARTVRGAGPASTASTACVSSAGNSGHQWHETWIYKTSDISILASGCNVFPCGHSLYKRSLATHPAMSGFGSTCVSDYNGTRTGFNYAVDNGWNNRIYNVWQDWPSFVNGGTPSELVPQSARSFYVALSAPRACASSCSSDQHDVALFQIDIDKKTVSGGPYWVTSQSGWEKFPHLARYGANYLLGWTAGSMAAMDFSTPAQYWIAEVNATGQILSGPVELPSSASFGYGTNWVTDPITGDVFWVRPSSATTVSVVRVRR